MDDDDGMSVGTDQSMHTAPSQASLQSADEEMPQVRDERLGRDETVRTIVSELDELMSSLPATPAASEAGNNNRDTNTGSNDDAATAARTAPTPATQPQGAPQFSAHSSLGAKNGGAGGDKTQERSGAVTLCALCAGFRHLQHPLRYWLRKAQLVPIPRQLAFELFSLVRAAKSFQSR